MFGLLREVQGVRESVSTSFQKAGPFQTPEFSETCHLTSEKMLRYAQSRVTLATLVARHWGGDLNVTTTVPNG